MRKTTIFSSAILMAIFGNAFAQSAATAPPRPVQGLFWKASSPTNTIYLLGSIHLGSKAMYPLPAVFENAYKRASVLIVEVDLNRLDQPGQAKIANVISAKGSYKGDDTLWKHVSPATKRKVEDFATANRFPVTVLSKMKPWLVALMASILPMQRAGMEAGLGIDKYFLDQAKGNKRVEELETVESQIKLVSEIPPESEENYLVSSLVGADRAKELGDTMQKEWIDGDADKLDSFVTRAFTSTSAIGRKMREDRNPHMADVAMSYLRKTEPCFIVVGAAHLIGKEGVIAILKHKGFRVEQLTSRPVVH